MESREKFIGILKHGKFKIKVSDLVREFGVSDATVRHWMWRKKLSAKNPEHLLQIYEYCKGRSTIKTA